MLISRTRWDIQEVDEEAAERLADQCGIHPLIARLLLIRGCETKEDVTRFLHAEHDALYDPYLLDGMQEAVAAVRRAVAENQHIRIYGDYDADGISSTSLMIWLLRELGAKFDYYIPHRVHEGYGLNKSSLQKAKDDGVDLIITVDTGISAVDEAAYAAELGLQLIITDHHEPPEVLPSAVAVINPKKPGCMYPFKQLAGVGVAFKLAEALLERVPERLAELAALGTIADLMPLIEENRTIVQIGLARMQQTSFVGLQELFQISGLHDKKINAGHIGFAIAPRINASGRLTSADAAVRLLTTDDQREASELAKQLDELNQERQRIVEQTVEEAHKQLVDPSSGHIPNVIVVSQEDWNPGVIGIAAARLLERYYRPTLVFTIDKETGIAKGSARSIRGFDIYRALTECADLLDHYGGHKAAAGMTLSADKLPQLERRLNELAAEWLSEEDFIPFTEADLTCSVADCTVELVEQLERLAPFGIGNRSPKFLLEQVSIQELRKIGKEGQHLKLVLVQDGVRLDTVGFGQGELAVHIAANAKVDLIGELAINEWNGTRKVQLLLQDIRVNHLQVFDWRGLQPTRLTTSALVSRFTGLREQTSFVICENHPRWLKMITEMFGERTVYLLDESGSLSLVRGQGGQDGQEEGNESGSITDLVLVHLPRSKAALDQLLALHRSSLQRICVWLLDADRAAAGCPPRERFKLVYGLMKQKQSWLADDQSLLRAWSQQSGLDEADVRFIVQVFEELGFVEQLGGTYQFVQHPARRDLTESTLYSGRVKAQMLAEEWLLMTNEQMMQKLADGKPKQVEKAG